MIELVEIFFGIPMIKLRQAQSNIFGWTGLV